MPDLMSSEGCCCKIMMILWKRFKYNTAEQRSRGGARGCVARRGAGLGAGSIPSLDQYLHDLQIFDL